MTAACAILETVCKTFLEAEGHPLPGKQVIGALWPETAKHLRLQPGQLADDDLKRILQGLSSIADGVAATRTHKGSAHGRSGYEPANRYRLQPRHARFAVHAAHTMTMFVLETWQARKGGDVKPSFDFILEVLTLYFGKIQNKASFSSSAALKR